MCTEVFHGIFILFYENKNYDDDDPIKNNSKTSTLTDKTLSTIYAKKIKTKYTTDIVIVL